MGYAMPLSIADILGTQERLQASVHQKALGATKRRSDYTVILDNAFVDAKVLIDLYLQYGKVTKRNSIGHTRWLQARALLRVAGLWTASGHIRGNGLRRSHYLLLLDDAYSRCKAMPILFIKELPTSHHRLRYIKDVLQNTP
jgi:hypothetical protein